MPKNAKNRLKPNGMFEINPQNNDFNRFKHAKL